MRGTALAMLERGYDVHRMNLRGCGTKDVPFPVMYHAGLTIDLHSFLLELERDGLTPVFVAGFSLGGNLLLKLAAELGPEAAALIAGVCAVATLQHHQRRPAHVPALDRAFEPRITSYNVCSTKFLRCLGRDRLRL